MSDELQLIEATQGGDTETVRQLLDRGADVHERDAQGWTPLNWAAGRGDAEIVRLLLDHGADVTLTGRDNRTPLMIARAAGRDEVAESLAAAEKEKGVWKDPREHQPYCKAYYLGDLRKFPDWSEPHEAGGNGSGDGEAALTDESIVYLHQDFTVTRSMWHGEDVIREEVTPAWRSYCEGELEFRIPDDLR